MSRSAAIDVEAAIAALDTLDAEALKQRWRELYGRDAPYKARADFLRRGLAYRLQENAFGGLKPALARRLARIAEEAARGNDHAAVLTVAAGPAPGTRLLREWNGQTQLVEVLADGFLWSGQHFTSLTAVAQAITGTRWSGPRFFGLGARS
ncbi:DUF2924 domain-containing protein [Oleomonas cavernae]|uniref:DUF2924 domain-containing protein n=1 Tax=Oleomonas cavernae TaxID=2320859 RepID=A0A418WFS6_9PROT|nr:DUF2924 domain-containing protein [Oleomonas cavernae]RJF88875.1 DUF2924 domain-containing protein [Oleomonas cavernae]